MKGAVGIILAFNQSTWIDREHSNDTYVSNVSQSPISLLETALFFFYVLYVIFTPYL